MDPNPKNIVSVDGGLKFIDFECCYLGEVSEDFYYGFSLGYLYHFWLNKFFDEKEYDNFVYDCIGEKDWLNKFSAYYERFKSKKVSRKKRFKCFFEVEERDSLLFEGS